MPESNEIDIIITDRDSFTVVFTSSLADLLPKKEKNMLIMTSGHVLSPISRRILGKVSPFSLDDAQIMRDLAPIAVIRLPFPECQLIQSRYDAAMDYFKDPHLIMALRKVCETRPYINQSGLNLDLGITKLIAQELLMILINFKIYRGAGGSIVRVKDWQESFNKHTKSEPMTIVASKGSDGDEIKTIIAQFDHIEDYGEPIERDGKYYYLEFPKGTRGRHANFGYVYGGGDKRSLTDHEINKLELVWMKENEKDAKKYNPKMLDKDENDENDNNIDIETIAPPKYDDETPKKAPQSLREQKKSKSSSSIRGKTLKKRK